MKYKTKNGSIVLGDAIHLMKKLKSNSVDLIVTDPPYRVISGGYKSKACGGILSKNDGKIFRHNDTSISLWITEAYRVLKPSSHLYIMTNFLNLENFMREIKKAGFKIHNLLIWEKNNVLPNRWYMKNCEYTLLCRKGKAKTINNKSSKTVHRISQETKSVKIHPTQKPVELMKMYIANSSNKGDLVLDPFCGSGAVAVASVLLKRKFLSFEIDQSYFNSSVQRLKSLAFMLHPKLGKSL